MSFINRLLPLVLPFAMLPVSVQAAPNAAPGQCEQAPGGIEVDAREGVRIRIRTIGKGTPILFIPSLARGVADFDEVASSLAREGYMSILPDPRGTGRTQGPAPASLFDLAHDAEVAAARLCNGPVHVVGHAFGNRVARALATSSPGTVRDVVLLAGGGKAKSLPQVGDSITVSASESGFSDAVRLKALQTAFFAQGHDPRVWLTGWYGQALAFQGAAMKGSSVDQWWSGGSAPILLVQADEDPVAPSGNADQLKADIGDRLRTVTLRRASHAILPEQPGAVAWLLARYFAGERDETVLQEGTDARVER